MGCFVDGIQQTMKTFVNTIFNHVLQTPHDWLVIKSGLNIIFFRRLSEIQTIIVPTEQAEVLLPPVFLYNDM